MTNDLSDVEFLSLYPMGVARLHRDYPRWKKLTERPDYEQLLDRAADTPELRNRERVIRGPRS